MQVDIRKLSLDDYDELVESMQEAYPDIEDNTGQKKYSEINFHIPGGTLCITVDGKLAAAALSIIVQYELFGDQHTYDEITGSGTFNTHTNNGSVLYGIEVLSTPKIPAFRTKVV